MSKKRMPPETALQSEPCPQANSRQGMACTVVPDLGLPETEKNSFRCMSSPTILLLTALAAAFLWTYWPTMRELAQAWNVEPDYSHGYLVAPLAACFLWLRRAQMPRPQGPGWLGAVLIAVALALHLLGGLYYLEPLSGWSISLWLTGAVWLMAGAAFARWCLPATLFLLFMVPLPYSLEALFRQPLQRVATEMSCWVLQSLGMPALAMGNIIVLNDVELEVAQACSGLRIFTSIFALAFAYGAIMQKPWWINSLIFLSALPIAVVANVMRVCLIAVTYPHITTVASRHLMHDAAGWLVIPCAAALMGGFIWYLGKLIVPISPASARELLRGSAPAAS